MLASHQWGLVTITWRQLTQEILQPWITKIGLKITYLKCHLNLPGPNEFKPYSLEWLAWNGAIIAGEPVMIARPKRGLFRYHVKRIHFTMQGFAFLSAIFDEAKLKASYYYGCGSAAIIQSREIWSAERLLFETIYKQIVWLFYPFDLQFLSTVFQLK